MVTSVIWSVANAHLLLRPIWFLRATAVPAGTAVARISYGDSVCPSVCLGCHDPVPNQAQVR